jgi:hypothetical protein
MISLKYSVTYSQATISKANNLLAIQPKENGIKQCLLGFVK